MDDDDLDELPMQVLTSCFRSFLPRQNMHEQCSQGADCGAATTAAAPSPSPAAGAKQVTPWWRKAFPPLESVQFPTPAARVEGLAWIEKLDLVERAGVQSVNARYLTLLEPVNVMNPGGLIVMQLYAKFVSKKPRPLLDLAITMR